MTTIQTSAALAAALCALAFPLTAHAVNYENCTVAEDCGIIPQVREFEPSGGVKGIGAGDLIKLASDGDPATHHDEAVYYLDKDWKRHPFPSLAVYQSWYPSWDGIKTLTPEEMDKFRLGRPVTFRPGSRLIKIPSIPKVYAVEPGGALRWIESEDVAVALFGADWNKRVADVDETAFGDYHETVSLATPQWPTGIVLRRAEDGQLFFVDGYAKRALTAESLGTMHLNTAFAVTVTEAQLNELPDIGAPAEGDRRFSDTAQQDFVDTLPSPQLQVLRDAESPAIGEDAVIAVLHFQVGEPIILKRVVVSFAGLPENAATPPLSKLHVTDEAGEDLFGMQDIAADAMSVTFKGAYTSGTNVAGDLFVRATLSPELAGTEFTTRIEQDSLSVFHGKSGRLIAWYWRATDGFPAIAVTPVAAE